MKRPPFASDHDAEASVYVSGRPGLAAGNPESMSPGVRRRRAFTLVFLTLLIPGTAQLAVGNKRLGRTGIRAWLSLLAAAAVLALAFLVSRSLVLGLFGRSWFLTLVQWVLLGFAALWAVLFLDAWRLGQPGSLVINARRWFTGLTSALLVVTSGGLVYAANNVGAGRDALNSLFQGNRAVDSTDGRYNVLFLGGDSGKNRVGTRPDSIQLVSIDDDNGRAVMFGFSRDTENINFREGSVMKRLMPEGWNCGDECLLNGLYTWAQDNRDKFPAGEQDPGVLATREAVEALTGLDVHYYAMVDLQGFSKMIDALGGLDVNVQKRTPIGGGTSPITGWIKPGQQHLDGKHALWYARSREGSTNYERMARQRCVMTAMAQQLDPRTVVLRFQDIAKASTGVIRTDLPQSELGYFADLALKTRSQKIRSVNFVPPLIKPWDYDPKAIRSTVRSAIASSEASKEKPRPATKTGTATAAQGAKAAPKPPTSAGQGQSAPGSAAVAPSPGGKAVEADASSVCSASS